MKSSNEQTLKVLQDNVSGVITQINVIRSSTSTILTEQKEIKSQVTKFEESASINEKKKILEADLNKVKHT